MAWYHVGGCDCPVGCCDCHSGPHPKFDGYTLHLDDNEVTVKEYWSNTVNRNREYIEFFLTEDEAAEYYNNLLKIFKDAKILCDIQNLKPYRRLRLSRDNVTPVEYYYAR